MFLLELGLELGELFLLSADHLADLPGINEERLPLTAAKAPLAVGFFGFSEKPETNGNLGGVEKLARKGHHAVHQVIFHQFLTDQSFAFGVGGHGPIGQNKACQTAIRNLRS